MKVHYRSFGIALAILFVYSSACTQIPLFNYLGFEFSALTALVAGFVSGILTIKLQKEASFESKGDVWRFVGETSLVQLILLAIPFLLSLANATFVKNCSIGDGVILYALIVLPGALFSISLAMFVSIVFERWRRTMFIILYVLILLHIPLVTLLCPQIFAFNPIIGFFPGFSYDETLQVTQRLLTYRLSTIAVSGCIFTVTLLIWQMRFKKAKHTETSLHSVPIIEISILALLVPIVLVMLSFSDRLGLSSSEQFIRQKLAGNYSTTHFEIIYPAGSIKRERVEQLGRLHEFYFDKITRELNIHSHERICSFIYASPEQKGRFIGATRTDIAKPWLQQMHINLADVESALKHEMVHVLAAEFGWSPLKIAPNSGLIEGLAVAMEHTTMEEPLDRASALAFAAGLTQISNRFLLLRPF